MKRSCGVLLPISSLPSPYGIGTLGAAAYEFVDFLAAAGQSYWQILPVGPTGRICHQDCPASARKSTNFRASAPSVPMPWGEGREEIGMRMPLLLFMCGTSQPLTAPAATPLIMCFWHSR